jgi:hypothetical protein
VWGVRAAPVPFPVPTIWLRLRRSSLLLLSLLAGLGVLVARRPDAILRPQFWAEGGPIFYAPTYFHDAPTLIVAPYAGYLHLAPRLVAEAERWVPPYHAPQLGALISLAVVVLLAALLASERLANVLPARWMRIALAGLLIATPSAYEILGVEVNLQVYLAVYLVALAIARPSTGWVGRLADGIGAILAGLSGPFSILLAPLFWLRRGWLALIVTACATNQTAAILLAPQRPITLASAGDVLDVVLLRINSAVLGSTVGSSVPPALAIGLIAATVVLVLGAPFRKAWAPFMYAALVVSAAAVVSDGAGLGVHARYGERFFLMASLAAGLLIVCGLLSPYRPTVVTAKVMGVLLILGIAVDLRIPAFPDANWEEGSQCVGSARTCLVQMEPDAFTFVWPGTDGGYPIPITRPTDE